MTIDISAVLAHTLTDVFENMAFVFVDPVADLPSEAAADMIGSAVRYHGPQSGKLQLAVSSAVLEEVTANMLGVEIGEPESNDCMDALKELANVICGNLTPLLADKIETFEISPPEIIPIAQLQTAVEPYVVTAEAILDADTGYCLARLLADKGSQRCDEGKP